MKAQFHPVKSNDECEKIVSGTYQGVLSMSNHDMPYALPMNHACKDGRFCFHCASSGRKLDTIDRNPSATYVISKYYGDSAELAKSMRCHGHWESVIAYGTARVISERAELIRTLRTYMEYYRQGDYQHGDELANNTNVIVIDVDRMSARREYDEVRPDYWTWEKEA